MDASLAERLERTDAGPSVTALPDGSVDRFYEVFGDDGRIRRREAFASAVVTGRTAAFTLRETAVEPGGHAVNAAVQAHSLGDDVALVGHLDDPAFADLPFETYSTGEPAEVAVHGFDDGDLLTVAPSADVESWSLADVRAATGDRFRSLLTADVVFLANWATLDGIPDAVAELAAADLDGGYLIFDPGEAQARADAAVLRLLDALADLSAAYDVVLAANGDETRALASALRDGDQTEDLAGATDRLRTAADLTAAVVHETDAAVAATPSGRVRVENYDVEPVRNTGGGDRFDAGLGHALALGWSWADALELGNACASRYVATGATGGATDLAAFLRERG